MTSPTAEAGQNPDPQNTPSTPQPDAQPVVDVAGAPAAPAVAGPATPPRAMRPRQAQAAGGQAGGAQAPNQPGNQAPQQRQQPIRVDRFGNLIWWKFRPGTTRQQFSIIHGPKSMDYKDMPELMRDNLGAGVDSYDISNVDFSAVPLTDLIFVVVVNWNGNAKLGEGNRGITNYVRNAQQRVQPPAPAPAPAPVARTTNAPAAPAQTGTTVNAPDPNAPANPGAQGTTVANNTQALPTSGNIPSVNQNVTVNQTTPGTTDGKILMAVIGLAVVVATIYLVTILLKSSSALDSAMSKLSTQSVLIEELRLKSMTPAPTATSTPPPAPEQKKETSALEKSAPIIIHDVIERKSTPVASGGEWYQDENMVVLWNDCLEKAVLNPPSNCFEVYATIPAGQKPTGFTYPAGWDFTPSANKSFIRGAYNLGSKSDPKWSAPLSYPGKNVTAFLAKNDNELTEHIVFTLTRKTPASRLE